MADRASVDKLLYRTRDVADALGISASLVEQYRRRGLLTPVRLPEVRAVRFARAEVEALARRWCVEAGIGNQEKA